MYLKSIEMQGFKSFANKTILQFHDGITGVVGPNGSGKSNVGDAVRWVLGEQSAKQLRGGNMQDVIFSGTETRKPLGYASVAITLDNSDHKLNVDFEEVTVTRRLYRSGESEYLMNGASCRLKDINELFYDTGIGKEGYSIIGQGQIDKILSGKPEERRELFDEAAGIVKFKRRKAVTEKKLAEEQQNLVRVNDILSELTRQLEPLERQSETAKIYLKKKEELKILDINMFLLEMERIRNDLAKVEDRYRIAEEQLKSTKEAFEHTKQEYEKLEQEQEKLDQTILSARDQAGENALKRQQLENQIEVLNEQIHASERNSDTLRERLEAIRAESRTKTAEKNTYQAEKDGLHEALLASETEKSEKEAALSECQEQIQAVELQSEQDKSEVIGLLNQRGSTKGKMQRYDAMLEQIGIRKAELSQRVLHLKTSESEQNGQMEELQNAFEALEETVSSLKQQYQEADQKITALTADLSNQTKEMEAGQTNYHREASRLESLKNITERYDGYGNSIRKVMEQKDRNPGIHGVVADLLQAEKKYETAIETALGGSIQNIVTDNEATAKYLIEYLKRGHFGRATFLPLTSMRGKKTQVNEDAARETGVLGVANALVSYDPVYEGLVAQLLGRTLVVDTIDHAIVIQRKYRQTLRMVTLEGELLSPGGSMTGGAFKNNSNLLGRRREIEELERSVGILKKELEETQRAIGENRSRRNVLRDTIADFQQQLQQQYVEQNTAKMNLAQIQEKEDEIQSSYRRIEREQEELRQQAGEIRQDHSSIARELEDSQKDEKELEVFIETKQKELEEWKAEETEKNHVLEKIRLEESSLEQQNHFLQENISRLENEIEAYHRESEEITENLSRSAEEIHKKEDGIEELKKAVTECTGKEEVLDARRIEWQEEKEKRSTSHKSFFEKRDHLSEKTSLLDKECFRLRSQAEKIEEQRESQISYMWEEYEITPNNALQYRKEELTDRQTIKKDVLRIKDEIRKLGSVNVNAIEDYKNLLERHTFLSAQYEDIVKAEETLEGIIQELDEGMRKQFTEKFRDIQREFDKAFKELFGGGKGTLELAEDEDILEAGIRIISQPPGKKLQNMMQLSGGEKALTAIALLFAIQNLKPSPFCLLDEIEAALDDSNVGRFASYLQKLTKNTQFIIITHRRGTMNAADRLYGITMQEKGVSTLVSVDLVENQLTK